MSQQCCHGDAQLICEMVDPCISVAIGERPHVARAEVLSGAGTSVGLSDCSDEILLNILLHVPPQDLLLNVARTCRRLLALSRDKTLISHISLSGQYSVADGDVRAVLRSARAELLCLDLSGCYWLSSACVCEAWRCARLRRLDVTGCVLSPGRLARVLASTGELRELALDVGRGFDLRPLFADCRRTLARLHALTQTLLAPSYGVLPLCPALQRLELRLEVGGACEGGVELAVSQSSVPHYQNLSCFSARLAPGAANHTMLAMLLAPLSVRPITRLHRLILSAPGPAPPRPLALGGLLDSLGDGLAQGGGASTTALQLPGSWLDGPGLGRVLSRGCPAYISLARGGPSLCLPDYDLHPLRSLNLSGCGQELDSDWLQALCKSCPLLRHLNLSGMHYHHSDRGAMATAETHPCSVIATLSQLLSLALSVCAVAEGDRSSAPSPAETNPLLQGLRKARRVGVETYQPGSEVAGPAAGVACLRQLLIGCQLLQELELVGAEFCSATPRYDPPIRKQVAGCACARGVGEVAVATLACRPSLRVLTLAALPGLQTGAGLCQLAQHCRNLTALSLGNLGNTHTHTHTLLQALPHCQRLRDLRVEQPYFSASAAFFEALAACASLQRLCIVSRNGTFVPAAVTSFMHRHGNVVMCHLFMGGTLVACRALQKSLLDSLSSSRPALSVVVFPLLHEDLPQVVREIPLTHLDQITLYKSRVAQQPPV